MEPPLDADAYREIVRRVLDRVQADARPRGKTPPWLERVPPELRGTYVGRWDEPPPDDAALPGPTTGPTAGRCRGCGTPGACLWVCPVTATRMLIEGADRIGATLGAKSAPGGIAGRIDHTLLKPDAMAQQIDGLCDEAIRYRFATVCLNPHWVPRAVARLRGHGVPVCAVVGFPLGANSTEVKAREARLCVEEGASEIDMVLQIGLLKSRDHRAVAEDIRAVVRTAGVPVKVILETALLTRDEKIEACTLAKAAGAAFVKTSTGFGPSGATVDDVRLMREIVGEDMAIKASGGIRDLDTAQRLIEAGADRIGASASVRIAERESKRAARA